MPAKEYLSFILESEEYAVPILDVREVRGWSSVRSVPNSPSYLLGVLEIRGEYVPIVDLRMRFNLSPSSVNATTVVIVLNDSNQRPLGVIVDAVAEVYVLDSDAIKPAPNMSFTLDESYINGIASGVNGHLIIINIEALFDVKELSQSSVEEVLM